MAAVADKSRTTKTRTETSSHVHGERDGRVVTLTLDAPPQNFLTTGITAELDRALRCLERDRTVGAIVLQSALPRVFASHYDIGGLIAGGEGVPFPVGPRAAGATLRLGGFARRYLRAGRLLARTPLRGANEILSFHDMIKRMRRMDKVVIAAINGRAFGGAAELVGACDLRLMAADLPSHAGVGQPEIMLGLIPGGGGTQALARAVGGSRALELMLDPRLLSAQEALEIGYVHRLVPATELRAEAHATAERVARRSPQAVGAIKQAVYWGGRSSERGLHVERSGFLSTVTSKYARRTMRAYYAYLSERIAEGSDPFEPDGFRPWLEGTAVNGASASLEHDEERTGVASS